MRSHPDDRTSRAIIRDEALRLFATRGADAVTVRQIAAASRVSPALIVRHYGSKDGLREAVDAHVLGTFEAIFAELTRPDGPPHVPESAASMADALLRLLPPQSLIPRYLGRMLLDGGEAGRTLFGHVFDLGEATLRAMVKAGRAMPGADLRTRAAFLTANDLAVLLLRDYLTEWLGVDPLSGEGGARWSSEVFTIYSDGLGDASKKTSAHKRRKHP